MFHWEETSDNLACRMSSSVSMIERAIQGCRDFVVPGDGDADILVQVLRELLINAFEHGNCSRSEGEIGLGVQRISPGRFQAAVRDQGKGFVLEERNDPGMPENVSLRHRGLAIVHSLCDEIEIASGEGRVTAWVTLPKLVHMSLVIQGDCWVLRPDGDLSALVAWEFREALLRWLESSARQCSLDLSQVRTIDSICLSVLLSFHRELAERGAGRGFSLEEIPPRLMSLFFLTRIERLFEIKPAKEELLHV